MKKFAVVVLVLSFLALTVASFAADQPQGQGERKHLDPALICSGVVKSVTKDGDTLKSFVLTTMATPEKPAADVTISVTDKTKYMKGKTAATSADVVVGAKVLVRLKAALVDNAGTAVVVRILPAETPRKHHGNK